MRNLARYTVYTRRKRDKRAKGCGFYTDDFSRAIDIAKRAAESQWAPFYSWVKVKDTRTGKYVYTALEVSAE